MNHVKEAEYTVPPKWTDDHLESHSNVEAIEFRGGMIEPNCYDGWCRSTGEDLIRWKGPSGNHQQWIDANGEIHDYVGRNKEEEEAEEL